jgi:hypothetical protein
MLYYIKNAVFAKYQEVFYKFLVFLLHTARDSRGYIKKYRFYEKDVAAPVSRGAVGILYCK